jgi:hypothetical protein
MASTAEALMDTLAGGGDESTGSDQETAAAGTPAEQANAGPPVATTLEQGVASDSPAEVKAGEPAAAKPPDQVANLNAAIRETRSENKALKQQLQELTAKIEALSKPAQPAAQTQGEQEPDFLADPKGYVDAQKAKLKQLEEKLEADKKSQTEQAEQQKKAQETWNKVLESEAQFVAATPDYHEALAHVRSVRTQQLQMMHPDATPQQIAQHIQGEEFQGAAALVAQGKNPSEFYYNYAKTFGYKPKASPAPATNQQQRPDKDAVRTMGSGGGADHVDSDEPAGALGILAAAQNEHKAQFKRRK